MRVGFKALACGEEGVSYTLPFVLLVPFYLFFVLIVFETAFLLLAKIGTMYAAHAGARSAVVWQSAQPEALRQPRVQQAVLTALAPFAVDNRASAGGTAAEAVEFANAYTAASSPGQAVPTTLGLPADYSPQGLQNRYGSAADRTTIAIDWGTGKPNSDVSVTVTYSAPLHVPVVAAWLGRQYTMTSTATLPSEAPRSADGTLGIGYQSTGGSQP
jgi:hypothetical protein